MSELCPSVSVSWLMMLARELAASFASLPGVVEVFLFGSLARQGEGHDVDMILVVEGDLAQRFHEIMAIDRELGYSDTRHRQDTLATMFGVHIMALVSNCREACQMWCDDDSWRSHSTLCPEMIQDFVDYVHEACLVDPLVFPVDWRNQIDQLQEVYAGHGGDPQFMINLMHDLKCHDPVTGEFVAMVG